MKLNNFIFENKPDSSASAHMILQKILPGIKIIMNSDRQLVAVENRGYNGWLLITALLNRSQKDITDSIVTQIHTHNEYTWLTEWKTKMSELVENGVTRIIPKLPYGWRIDHYNLRFLDNPMDPFFTITFSKDEDRQIHASGHWWYHITPLSNLENIKTNGLMPKSSSRHSMFGTYSNKLFLISKTTMIKKLPKVKELAKQLQSKISNVNGPHFEKPGAFQQVVVFKVKVPISVHLYQDTKSDNLDASYVRYGIPPENLEVVYTGSIDNMHI